MESTSERDRKLNLITELNAIDLQSNSGDEKHYVETLKPTAKARK